MSTTDEHPDRTDAESAGSAAAVIEESAAQSSSVAYDESGGEAGEESAEHKLQLEVVIDDVGPCRKHIQVRVPAEDIQYFRTEAVREISDTVDVPGFRRGHVPERLIAKKFKNELSGQIKQQVLVESMEQLAEEHKLDPINEPNIDVESIEIPDEGDLEYEFDVEVRPEFELPDYRGLTIKRPVREVTDDDVEVYMDRFLSEFGHPVVHDGPIEPGDHVTLDALFTHDGERLHRIPRLKVQVRETLGFHDARIEGFDALLAGASQGDVRETDFTISAETQQLEMRNEPVHAEFTVVEVRRLEQPEFDKELQSRIGVDSKDVLRESVRQTLERQMAYQQRQSARRQVLERITESADWELPEDLVLRQVENARRREILEMQQAGFPDQEIQARDNEIRQQAVSTTRQALKEHFVLDRIATEENIDANQADVEEEIRLMAGQRGESPRRVRARLQKSGMVENLEAQIRERLAVEFILKHARFEDLPVDAPVESKVESVDYSVCGFRPEDAAAAAEDEDEDDSSQETDADAEE